MFGDKLHINLDVSFPFMPCDILSLDVQDVMGTHIVDVGVTLHKTRLSKKGEKTSSEIMVGPQGMITQEYVKAARKAHADGEGCNIHGFLQINRVPGNIHISTHAYAFVVQQMIEDEIVLDFSHIINHFSFGDPKDIKSIRESF